MADWPGITDSQCDPDAPLTSNLIYGLRDGAIAIAECADNSPYMATAWHPYNGTNIGDGNTGRLWSFAADGAVTEIETPVFVPGYEYMLDVRSVGHSSTTSQDFQLAFRGAPSGTYSAYSTFLTVPSSTPFINSLSTTLRILRPSSQPIDMVSGVPTFKHNGTTPAATASDTSTDRFKIRVTGGQINRGEVRLFKQRIYI